MAKYIFFLIYTVFCFLPFPGYSETDYPAPVYDSRYERNYDKGFFLLGGERVRFNKNLHLKIGVVIRNKSRMDIKDIIAVIFSSAPFDRYREFFVFVLQEDIDKAKRSRNYFIKAYDSSARAVPGGYDVSSSSVRAGLVVLKVDDPTFSNTQTLGYAQNKLAVAQKITILHELGHVLADLADEYSVNLDSSSREAKDALLKSVGMPVDYHKNLVWNTEHANLDYRTRKFLKWQPLIDSGIISDKRENRVQIDENKDVGRFVIPTERCIMNRIVGEHMSFCPVCQLQIIDAICRLSGVNPPWEE